MELYIFYTHQVCDDIKSINQQKLLNKHMKKDLGSLKLSGALQGYTGILITRDIAIEALKKSS